MTTYEITSEFKASTDGLTTKTYNVGDIVTPNSQNENAQLAHAVGRGHAIAYLPKALQERITKIKRAPKVK